MFAGELFCKLGDDFAKVVLRVTIATARFVLLLTAMAAAQAASAATYTWNGGPSGPWDTASNWTPAGVAWTQSSAGTANTALFNTAGASVTVSSGSDTATSIIFAQNTTLSGGTINLVAGNNNLVNSATGATTLGTALNFVGPSASILWGGGSGTLNINAPITNSVNNFFFYDGNYTLNSPGSININGYALVMNDSASTTSNVLQTGGLISINRPNSVGLYLTQVGTTSYTLTGGSIMLSGIGCDLAIADGAGRPGTMTINGAAPWWRRPGIEPEYSRRHGRLDERRGQPPKRSVANRQPGAKRR